MSDLLRFTNIQVQIVQNKATNAYMVRVRAPQFQLTQDLLVATEELAVQLVARCIRQILEQPEWVRRHKPNLGPYSAGNHEHCVNCGKMAPIDNDDVCHPQVLV